MLGGVANVLHKHLTRVSEFKLAICLAISALLGCRVGALSQVRAHQTRNTRTFGTFNQGLAITYRCSTPSYVVAKEITEEGCKEAKG